MLDEECFQNECLQVVEKSYGYFCQTGRGNAQGEQ